MAASATKLKYDGGTILLSGDIPEKMPGMFEWDERVEAFRAPAVARRGALAALAKSGVCVEDLSSQASTLSLKLRCSFKPHPYQEEAFQAWKAANYCGTVVLPTGSGKTLVALSAMAHIKTSTLVVAPTIDLMSQWYSLLVDSFGMEVGILGGGYHDIRNITVTTYDSAYIYAGEYGDRFDLIIFDEVHHLPSPKYQQIPLMSTAAYRMGLTATYERQDGAETTLEYLVGPVVYRIGLDELTGTYLAEYDVVRIKADLTDDEAEAYRESANVYFAFVRKSGIQPFGAGWVELVKLSAHDADARKALLAKQEMKRIVISSERKLEILDSIMKQHSHDRTIIFTEQNDLVYRISREFLIPAITHHTKAQERKWILDGFKEGTFRAVVTSKVLNEGIDVPSAKIAIILSGSASPREYSQRLGRVLRRSEDRNRAILYELVTPSTTEVNVSARRRRKDANA